MRKFTTLRKAEIILCLGFIAFFSSSFYKDQQKEENPLAVKTITTGILGARIDAITLDQKGNIYASQFGKFSGPNGDGCTVFKIDSYGNTSEFITDLSGPLGNAVDSQGNFYVVHNNNSTLGEVLKIAADGTRTILATIDGFPSGLTLDSHNNVYVSNFINPTIHKITPEGISSIYASNDQLSGVVGIDFDNEGNLIAGNYSTADILSIDPQGKVILVANIPNIIDSGAGIGYLTIAHNSIFATGIKVHKIFKITMDGTISHFAGSGEKGFEDGDLLDATFNKPNGIVFSKNDNVLYISEYNSSAIRAIKF